MMLGKYFKKTVFRKEHTADGVVPEAPQGARTANISKLRDQIFGEFLAYLQKIDEFCVQVAHNEVV